MPCFVLSACSQFVIKSTDNAYIKCSKIMPILENQVFLSCPLSKGPNAVVSHLEKLPTFVRNKDYDYGDGSVRFNARNASLFDLKLIDGKSLFLLNYHHNDKGEETFSLFQAIYFFETEEDKNLSYYKIIDLLEKKLMLTPQIKYDIAINTYQRYYLPCGSGINLKQTKDQTDKHIIDILWVPDTSAK